MENLKKINLRQLKMKDKMKIKGGGVHPIIWMAAFHIAKEAYNNWDAHKEAFMEGYNS